MVEDWIIDELDIVLNALVECKSYIDLNSGDIYMYPPYTKEPLPDIVEDALKRLLWLKQL